MTNKYTIYVVVWSMDFVEDEEFRTTSERRADRVYAERMRNRRTQNVWRWSEEVEWLRERPSG